jgi:hypothetical protein
VDAKQAAIDKVEREKAALALAKKKAEEEAERRQEEARRANLRAMAEQTARREAEVSPRSSSSYPFDEK